MGLFRLLWWAAAGCIAAADSWYPEGTARERGREKRSGSNRPCRFHALFLNHDVWCFGSGRTVRWKGRWVYFLPSRLHAGRAGFDTCLGIQSLTMEIHGYGSGMKDLIPSKPCRKSNAIISSWAKLARSLVTTHFRPCLSRESLIFRAMALHV